MRMMSVRHRIALVALLALALGLRLYRLDSQSLWNDEGTSVALAQRDVETILRNAADDIHPPLYYLALRAWVQAFGNTELAVRGLSVLMGVLVVAGTYLLTRQLLSGRYALLAALFAALSPFQVYYSQETRMYIGGTLAALALVAACYALFTRWDRRPTLVAWPAVAVIAAGLTVLYTHYYGITVLLAVNVAFLIWCSLKRQSRGAFPWGAVWRWAAIMLVTCLAFVPWLLSVWSTIIHWPAVSAPRSLLQLTKDLTVVLPLGITAPDGAFSATIGAIAALLACVGLIALPRQERGLYAEQPAWQPWLLACYAGVPILVVVAGSLRQPMYNAKFILLITPAVHILLAAGTGAIAGVRSRNASPRRRLVTHAVAFFCAATVIAGCVWSLDHLYSDPRYARDDYRGVMSTIHSTAGPDAAILINAPSQIETVDYYHDAPPPMYPLARQRPMDVERTIAELEEIVQKHDQLYGIFWATADSDPNGVIENWLAEHTFKTMDQWYGNIRLVAYSVPSPAGEADSVAVDAVLGDRIRLRSYRILTAMPRSGGTLQLALEWELLAPIQTRYTVFAQVLDAQNQIVGQHDSEPAGGREPTTSWVPGQIVTDNRGIPIQAGTPAGRYTLLVGIYDPATGMRLPVTLEGEPAGDAVTLVKVSITESAE